MPENPFVPNTVISSSAVNSDFSDIADALTESLARDGQGGMQAVLPLDATGFAYNNDTNTGMYRTSADSQAIKCGGVDIVDITSSGIDVTGSIKQSGSALLPIGLGPLPWTLPTAPPLWVFSFGQACTSSYAAYRALLVANGSPFGSNGTDPLFPDMRGRVPGALDNIGGVTANILTSTYFGTNTTVLGAKGGTESTSTTISSPNLPNVTLPITIASGQGSHTHLIDPFGTSGIVSDQVTSTTPLAASGSQLFRGILANATLPAMSGTAPLNGGVTQTAILKSTIQPSILFNYIIFVGV